MIESVLILAAFVVSFMLGYNLGQGYEEWRQRP